MKYIKIVTGDSGSRIPFPLESGYNERSECRRHLLPDSLFPFKVP